jgi:hypothetical protein
MDDVGVENSELEPQVPVTGPSDEAAPADEPRLWDDAPDAADGEPDVAAVEPEAAAAEPEVDPAPASEPAAAPDADPAEAAPVEEPVQPTLDEMVASIAEGAAAASLAVAEDAAAAAVEPAPSVDADVASAGDPETEPAEATDAPSAEAESVEEGPTEEAPAGEPTDEAPAAEPVELAAPEQAEAEAVPAEPVPYALQMRLRVPFWIEFAIFAAFVAAMVYLLWPASSGPFVTLPLYAAFVFGGAALVAIDLITALAVWLSARSAATDDEKVGLGRTLWMRAFAWTAGGVALWWIGIAVLELHRAGLLG